MLVVGAQEHMTSFGIRCRICFRERSRNAICRMSGFSRVFSVEHALNMMFAVRTFIP